MTDKFPKKLSGQDEHRSPCPDFAPHNSAIRTSSALGACSNPLTTLTGIRLPLQFHLPPVFRPLPRDLT